MPITPEQLEALHTEARRSRAFIRAAETQLSKVVTMADALLAQPDAPTPAPPPVEPPAIPADVYELKPGESISDALFRLEGRTTILLPKGSHDLFNQIADGTWKHDPKRAQGRITLLGDPRASRDDIVLHISQWATWRPHLDVDFEHLSLDWGNLHLNMHNVRFRDVRWFSSRGMLDTGAGKRNAPVSGPYTLEDSLVHDMLYGPTHATRVERCLIRNISGDALQGSHIVRDVVVDGMDGTQVSHHSDVFQEFAPSDGRLWENVIARNLKGIQGLMIQSFVPQQMPDQWDDWDERATIRNLTIRNVRIECEPVAQGSDPDWGGPPYSQFGGFFENVLIDNLHMPHQRLILRNHHGRGGYRNCIIRNSALHPGSTVDVPGVTVE